MYYKCYIESVQKKKYILTSCKKCLIFSVICKIVVYILYLKSEKKCVFLKMQINHGLAIVVVTLDLMIWIQISFRNWPHTKYKKNCRISNAAAFHNRMCLLFIVRFGHGKRTQQIQPSQYWPKDFILFTADKT